MGGRVKPWMRMTMGETALLSCVHSSASNQPHLLNFRRNLPCHAGWPFFVEAQSNLLKLKTGFVWFCTRSGISAEMGLRNDSIEVMRD
jgi:hypothetical protein